MGRDSAIGWTNHTYNAWLSCTKVSTGPKGACESCYAEAWAKRFGIEWGHGALRKRTSAHTRNQPYRWNRAADIARNPAKVFAHSLSDLFDNEVPQEWREDEYVVWRATPWLRWIVLTKRPGNIQRMLPRDWGQGYFNVGLVCSVATQAELDRDAGKLLEVPARWHGVSIEPQLEHVDVCAWLPGAFQHRSARVLRWVITGGESAQPGHDPRPYDLAWPRSLIDQCIGRCAVFVKQMGSNPVKTVGLVASGRHERVAFQHRAGADQHEWPTHLRVQQFPEEMR